MVGGSGCAPSQGTKPRFLSRWRWLVVEGEGEERSSTVEAGGEGRERKRERERDRRGREGTIVLYSILQCNIVV